MTATAERASSADGVQSDDDAAGGEADSAGPGRDDANDADAMQML